MTGTPPPVAFDWLAPEYGPIWDARIERIAKLRADPTLLEVVRENYAEHPEEFITDWGVTVDPRNVGTVRPVIMPFILFPLQIEFIRWLEERRRKKDDGTLVKSRDCGASWLAMAYACWLCIFHESVVVGFGSAKEEKVDSAGDPGSLFYKGRKFMAYLPREFKRDWSEKYHSAHRKIIFPWSESSIIGQAGDNIGRGDRTTMFFVDEFAVVERPKLVDGNLVATTDCRIEMSTVQGIANVFAERARGGLITRFDFPVEEDPRKFYRDSLGISVPHEWFKIKKSKMDPVVYASEYGRDFLASVEGIIIPQEWVLACIGALQKLGLTATGEERISYDVADQGKDKNCLAYAKGVELRYIESWAGTNSTIGKSVLRVYRACDERKVSAFTYDGDGMGAGVRSDVDRISEDRIAQQRPPVWVTMFRGSGEVVDKEDFCPGTDRTNEDFFENYKAQSWWALRHRAYLTWQWVTQGITCDPSDILSIDPQMRELEKTKSELSQPVWKWSKSGKMLVDKTPDDVASPNNGDAVMMLFPYSRGAMMIHDSVIEQFESKNPYDNS